jgi:hypothetical protein
MENFKLKLVCYYPEPDDKISLMVHQVIKRNEKKNVSSSQMITSMLSSSKMITPNVYCKVIIQPNNNINVSI